VNVAEIPVWGGYRALVDEVDYERLSAFKWHTHRSSRDKLYPVRTAEGRNSPPIMMSHDVVERRDLERIAYLDGNPFNNRRSNLRPVSWAVLSHRRFVASNTTGYKGVIRRNQEFTPFMASIEKNRRRYRISGFGSAIEAARAYNSLAKFLYGTDAYFNPIRSVDQFNDEFVLRWLASRRRKV
jgi:hypothetical protein